jgi:hypothetical protein
MNSKPQRKFKPSSKPSKKEEAQPVLSLPEKLQLAQSRADHWSQIAADPDLSLPAALFARNAARSYQAAATLGQKALAYQASPEKQEWEALQARLARSLGIIPSLPDQQPLESPLR